ncbi:HAD hydrolase-like protein [Rhodovulum sp. PH10]|uniref:HAD hydrolase-like protein n=1 Tax=Rhodovulum sp. PH10 TaxID=1187851 RepID=UPI0012FB681A|nr:HAD hydrolase-like protein [Rhodovulum sp. PH10]
MSDPATSRGAVLLDLDGTISDPAGGVTASFRHALARLGKPLPDGEPLTWIIGPPLRESFARVLGDDAMAAEALTLYREHHAAGALYDNRVYPGMAEAIGTLAGDGFRLFVATSKLVSFAEKIVARHGLSEVFAGVYGSSLDRKVEEKADVIALCLETEKLDPARCVMVGDRKHDVIGAAVNGLSCIGVTWGFGGIDELEEAGVTVLCDAPAALPGLVVQTIAGTRRSRGGA